MRVGLALALLLVAVPAAKAATVDVRTGYGARGGQVAEIRLLAAPGEANDVRVTYTVADGWVFEDSGAPLTAGEGCTGGGSRVACKTVLPHDTQVDLGDGADVALVERSGAFLTVKGGDGDDRIRDAAGRKSTLRGLWGEAGDDVLSSSRGGATLSGMSGSDRLTGSDTGEILQGGNGADTLRGGGGRDNLDPGVDSEPDMVDGGTGIDFLLYDGNFASPVPVAIDLVAQTSSMQDALRSIEGASGHYAADTLDGNARDNILSGLPGDDVLRGRGGDDRLEGSLGADTLSGGSGDDELIAGPGADSLSGGSGDDRLDPWRDEYAGSADPGTSAKQLDCGPGRDVLKLLNRERRPATGVPSDCELIFGAAGLGTMVARPELDARRATWSPLCPEVDGLTKRCRVTFVLRSGGAELGRGEFKAPRGARRDVAVTLNDAGRAFARSGGRLEVTLTVKQPVSYVVAVAAGR